MSWTRLNNKSRQPEDHAIFIGGLEHLLGKGMLVLLLPNHGRYVKCLPSKQGVALNDEAG